MKKKIIIGSMLSVFLLLSVAWVNPVYASETKPDPKGLHEKLSELAKSIVNDEDFWDLVNIIDIPETKDIFTRLLDPNNHEDPSVLAQEYYDVLVEEEKLEEYCNEIENLQDKYQSDYSIVEGKFTNIADTILNENNEDNENTNSDYYIFSRNDQIKIKKQRPSVQQEQIITFRSSDQTLTIPGIGTLSSENLEDIIKFLQDFATLLAFAGFVFIFIADIIGLVTVICMILDLEQIANILLGIFWIFAIIGLASFFGGIFLLIVANVLEDITYKLKNVKSKTKSDKIKILSILKNLKLNLFGFFKQLIQNLREKPSL